MRILVFLLATGLATATARADESAPNRALAESHFEAGQAAYREQRWATARIEFEAAYALSLEPDLLYNLSFTTEKQEQWAESLRFARQYLEAKGEALTVKDGDEVRGRIARLDALLAARTTAPTPNPPAATLQTPPQTPPPPALASGAAAATGLIVGGGVLVLGGIGCLAGAWITGEAARDPATNYQQWLDLGDKGRALNIAGLVMTIAGGSVVVAGIAWRVVATHRKR